MKPNFIDRLKWRLWCYFVYYANRLGFKLTLYKTIKGYNTTWYVAKDGKWSTKSGWKFTEHK